MTCISNQTEWTLNFDGPWGIYGRDTHYQTMSGFISTQMGSGVHSGTIFACERSYWISHRNFTNTFTVGGVDLVLVSFLELCRGWSPKMMRRLGDFVPWFVLFSERDTCLTRSCVHSFVAEGCKNNSSLSSSRNTTLRLCRYNSITD